jgi:O-antigen ligase
MILSSSDTYISNVDELFEINYSWAFKLLILLLIFNSFRPDRLLPGGSVLVYLPAVIQLILLFQWVNSSNKNISNAQTKLFFAFIITIAIGALFARNKSYSLLQVKNHFLWAFLSYLFTIQFIDTGFKVEKYTRLYLQFSVFLGLIGILFKAVVPIPVLHDQADFAMFMNILIPIGFFIGQAENSKWAKYFYYSATLIFIIGNIISFTRGGFLGLISVGLYTLVKIKKKIRTLSLLFIVGTAIIIFAPTSYWDKIETIYTEGAKEGTGKERIESWTAGWKMFVDNPIIGVGALNFGIWLPDYYVQYGSKERGNMWGRAAHSLYFTLLSETGIVGTLLFCFMLYKNYKDFNYLESLEKNKALLLKRANLSEKECKLVGDSIKTLYIFSLGYCGAMIGFLTSAMFLSVLWYGYFWILTSFFVMSSNAARRIETSLIKHSLLSGN